MGYSPANVIVPERPLSEWETSRGACSAGHSILLHTERWKVPGGTGRGFLRVQGWYCRRCCQGLTCKAGKHDLTEPVNVGKNGACRVCKVENQRLLNAKVAESRAVARAARAALGTHHIQQIINTSGPAPRWLVSGWPPREILDYGQCGGPANAWLFDPIQNATDDHARETMQAAESRLHKAATLCAGCPVRELCGSWATDRYLVYGEHRVAGGLYFGPRKAIRFTVDSRQISQIRI